MLLHYIYKNNYYDCTITKYQQQITMIINITKLQVLRFLPICQMTSLFYPGKVIGHHSPTTSQGCHYLHYLHPHLYRHQLHARPVCRSGGWGAHSAASWDSWEVVFGGVRGILAGQLVPGNNFDSRY